jgi:hypothetical protein
MREWQQSKEAMQRTTNSSRPIKLEYLSPQFIYNHRHNVTDPDPSDDEGMYGEDVMKILKCVGVVPESSYPYGKVEPVSAIRPTLLRLAAKSVIAGYAWVETLEGLKTALVNNGPCIICFPIYAPDALAMWRPPTPTSPLLGGHAMLVVGYNLRGFIVRNSWGVEWGGRGDTIYPYSDWGAHWEIWTTLDARDLP